MGDGGGGHGDAAGPGGGAGGPGGVFAARTGDEPHADDSPARARAVRSAWQGLIELRRMTHPDGATDRPCGWERAHLVRAAALALEAAGCRPATAGAGGYHVSESPQPEAVAVRAPTPEELRACAAALEHAGWQPSEHRDPRRRTRYLLASPRRA
jgi:hypothetical protein